MRNGTTVISHTREDTLEVLGTQVFALLALMLAVVTFGVAHTRATPADTGFPFVLPFAGPMAVALAGYGLWSTLGLAPRASGAWRAPAARRRIVAGLNQMLATSVVAALAGFLLAGARLDLLTLGQSWLTWTGYGFVLGAGLQMLVALCALGCLMLGRALPDLGD